MKSRTSRAEWILAAIVAGLIGAALLGPAVAQPSSYHDFADKATWWGVPCARDVLSNIPFALMGVLGLCVLASRGRQLRRLEREMAALFFAGLVLTAAASAWYHLQPDDPGLAIDRLGMTVAFAGILGLGATSHVSDRAGAALGLMVLLFAPLSVVYWQSSGNVLPWVVVQVGGLVLMILFGLLRGSGGTLRVRWGWVIAAYVVAKFFELNDHELFELTAHAASGHTLKHVSAALAAWPVISAISQRKMP